MGAARLHYHAARPTKRTAWLNCFSLSPLSSTVPTAAATAAATSFFQLCDTSVTITEATGPESVLVLSLLHL